MSISAKLTALEKLNLQNYKEKSDKVNFTCPLPNCGDNENNSRKARGYILNLNGYDTYYYCFHCSRSFTFNNFLKEVDYSVYQFYMNETKQRKMKDFKKQKKIKIVSQTTQNNQEKKIDKLSYKDAIPINKLSSNHIAKKYLIGRQIPECHYGRLFYFNGNPYKMFTEIFNSDKYKEKSEMNLDHEGIIIPKLNQNRNLVGFTIRILNKQSTLRYINLTLDDEDFFFNQGYVDWNRKIYILEGQFDLLSFKRIKDKMAMCSINKKFHLIRPGIDKKKIIYIIDNEYRKQQIIDSCKKVIEKGYSLMIWPKYVYAKDVNEFKIETGFNDDEMINFFAKHTYNGEVAKLMFAKRLKEEDESLII